MSYKKSVLYVNNPLNLSKTVDLPSNLLKARRKLVDIQIKTPDIQTIDVTQQEVTLNTPNKKQEQQIMVVEEKKTGKKGVLYKRLSQIQTQNQQLGNYSFSKLLSKMVIVDSTSRKKQSNDTYDHQNHRISMYSCLRGKILQMQCQNHKLPQRQRYSSILNDPANRTTKIFKRYYMPNNEKTKPAFFKTFSPEQKYIYINGKKTECKRIHNFYTSHHFRQSYDRAFGRTKDSFGLKRQQN